MPCPRWLDKRPRSQKERGRFLFGARIHLNNALVCMFQVLVRRSELVDRRIEVLVDLAQKSAIRSEVATD